MTPKIRTIVIHPPTCPPPTDMNWRLMTADDGKQWYLCWSKNKTLLEAGLPLLEGLLRATKGQEK